MRLPRMVLGAGTPSMVTHRWPDRGARVAGVVPAGECYGAWGCRAGDLIGNFTTGLQCRAAGGSSFCTGNQCADFIDDSASMNGFAVRQVGACNSDCASNETACFDGFGIACCAPGERCVSGRGCYQSL